MNATQLEAAVSEQISTLSTQSPAVAKLLLTKINYDMNVLREKGASRSSLLNLESRIMDIEHHLYQAKEKRAIPLDTEEQKSVLDELNSLSTSAKPEIRQRKTKLEVNQEIQQDLSEDLVAMVQKIRQNAEVFNEKLDADRSVVDTAADALQNASSNMGTVGARLQKYRKTSALGWWFYIYAVLFIVGSIVVGMILIQLFPKF